MKFVFLRRINFTVDNFFLRLYKQKDQYDKKLILLKNDNRGCFLWVSSGEEDEIGMKRRR
jgi:hypothetical protein